MIVVGELRLRDLAPLKTGLVHVKKRAAVAQWLRFFGGQQLSDLTYVRQFEDKKQHHNEIDRLLDGFTERDY
ncbi:hypothetical protein TNCV_4354301 [Trichonephila clavipes]|nr:hypothetical protein TNCV_4354301 [Trichonephila clavipes]